MEYGRKFLSDVHELERKMLDGQEAAKQAWNDFNEKWIVCPYTEADRAEARRALAWGSLQVTMERTGMVTL